MAEWIDWKVMFDKDMKIPGFKEEFDREYEEFCKQNDLDLAAERTRALRPVLTQMAAKRKSHGFSAKLKRTRAMA